MLHGKPARYGGFPGSFAFLTTATVTRTNRSLRRTAALRHAPSAKVLALFLWESCTCVVVACGLVEGWGTMCRVVKAVFALRLGYDAAVWDVLVLVTLERGCSRGLWMRLFMSDHSWGKLWSCMRDWGRR